MLYYVFDLLILSGRDVMSETLDARRALLENSNSSQLRTAPPPNPGSPFSIVSA